MCLCWNKQTLHGLFYKKIVLQFCSISTHVFSLSLSTHGPLILFLWSKRRPRRFVLLSYWSTEISEKSNVVCAFRNVRNDQRRRRHLSFRPWTARVPGDVLRFQPFSVRFSPNNRPIVRRPRSGYYERKHGVYHSYTRQSSVTRVYGFRTLVTCNIVFVRVRVTCRRPSVAFESNDLDTNADRRTLLPFIRHEHVACGRGQHACILLVRCMRLRSYAP